MPEILALGDIAGFADDEPSPRRTTVLDPDDIVGVVPDLPTVRLQPEQDRIALGQGDLEAEARASSAGQLAPRPFTPGAVPDAPVTTLERLEQVQQAPARLATGFMKGAAQSMVSTVAEPASAVLPRLSGRPQDAAVFDVGRQGLGELLAPEDVVEKVGAVGGQVAGSIAALAPAAMAGRAVAGAVTQGVSRVLPPLAARVTGTAAGALGATAGEAGVEGAAVYNEVLRQTGDPQQAQAAAAKAAALNVGLLSATNIPLIERARGVAGVVGRAISEGTQEGGQQVIQNRATGRPTWEGVPEAAAIGAVAGPVAGGLIDATTRPRVQAPTPQAQPVTTDTAQPRPTPTAQPSAPPVAPPSLSRQKTAAVDQASTPEAGTDVVTGPVPPAAPDTTATPDSRVDAVARELNVSTEDARRMIAALDVETARTPDAYVRATADDAVAHGYPGTAQAARADIEARARELYDATHADDVQRVSPTALLRAVADRGGLTVSRDLEEGGELAWLREFRDPKAVNALGGVPNVLRRATRNADGTMATGRTPEDMAELLRSDPAFAHLQTGHDLIEALAQAARDVRDGRGVDAFDVAYYARGAGIEPGQRWWEPRAPLSPDDIVGPADEADDLPDWALDDDAVAVDEPGVMGEGGAGRAAAPAPRRGLPPLRADLQAGGRGAMPADFERSGSPTRRPFFEEPPADLAERFKDAKPLSEQQAVEQLRQVFAEEVETGSPLGRSTRKLALRMKKVQPGAFGHYDINPRLIRLKRDFDLSTFTHELGHHIDFALFAKASRRPVGLFARELDDMGQATSPRSASRKYRQAEGVAEYFRIWFIDPEAARQRAPHFTQALEDTFAQHPDLQRQLEAGQGIVQQWASQSLTTRGKARISLTPDDPRRSVRQVLEDSYDRWIDDIAPLQRAVTDMAAESGRTPTDASNAYVRARNAAGAAGKAQGFVRFGVRGTNGRFLSGSLEDALAPVVHRLYPSGTTRETAPDFASYLVALRAREVRATKRDAGMTLPEADAIIRAVEQDPERAVFEKARDQVYAYQRALLAYGEQYGAFSGEQIAKITKLAEHYVPLQRVRDAAEGGVGGGKIANQNTPVKRLKGSGRDIIDPIESIVKNTQAMVDMVEKNLAMQALTTQAAKAPGAGKWLVRVQPDQLPTTFNLATVGTQIAGALQRAGVDVDTGISGGKPALFVGEDPVDLDELVTIFQPVAWGNPKDRIVTVIRDGQRQFWQVQDDALYTALTVMGTRPTSEVLKWTNYPVQTLRAGVTLAPAFAIRNVMRDTVGAMLQSRYGFIPVYDTARGLVSRLRQDADYKQFMASGVQSATRIDIKRARLREEVNRISRKKGAASATAYYVQPRNWIEALRAFSEAFETATRLGEFKLAKEAGGRDRRTGVLGIAQRLTDTAPKNQRWDEHLLTRASLAAADVTVDFRRGGQASKELSKWSAFFNARVQGYARMAETARRDPVGTALTAGTLAALSAALWAINKDDEEYQELSPQVKRDYWVLRTGDRAWVFIPKPHEWAVPGNVAEAFLEWATRHDPQAARDLVPDVSKTVVMTLAGTAILPWLEAAANWDMYRGRPLVPAYRTKLDPELQDSEWTTDTARGVGKLLGVSPTKLEHIIRQTGGTLASEALQAADLVATPLLNPTRAPRAEKRLEQLPILGGTLRDPSPSARSQSVVRWRDRLDDYETAKASIAELSARGDVEAAQRRFDKALRDLGVSEAERADVLRASRAAATRSTRRLEVALRIPRLDRIQQRMTTLSQEHAAIEGSREMTPAQKRTALDALFREMTTLARVGLQGSADEVKAATRGRRVPIPLAAR